MESLGKKHWQRPVNAHTKIPLPEMYGKCDNTHKCGEWVCPYKDGYVARMRQEGIDNWLNHTKMQNGNLYAKDKLAEAKLVHFDAKTYARTLSPESRSHNTFLNYFIHNHSFPFEMEEFEEVAGLYKLGTITKGNFNI